MLTIGGAAAIATEAAQAVSYPTPCSRLLFSFSRLPSS
eukprot:COSAG02_NODE_18381_length_942_cov_1.326216_1_plen_37_part_10